MNGKLTSILLLVLVLFLMTVSMILAATPDIPGQTLSPTNGISPAHDTYPGQVSIYAEQSPLGCSHAAY